VRLTEKAMRDFFSSAARVSAIAISVLPLPVGE
jgi:hypothetical protein